MIKITQTDYIDFISTSGYSKLTKVRALYNRDDYHPAFDFYKQLREEIVEVLKSRKHKGSLNDFLEKRVLDPKKLARYRRIVNGFSKFLGRKKSIWIDPPIYTWSYKELNIKMNPEIALEMNGEKVIIKLYFKENPLKRKDINILLWMMNESLCTGIYKGHKCALLDLEKGKFFEFKDDNTDLVGLVEGEAECFIRLWNQLEKKSA